MKEAFLKSSCTTVQVDTSFDFDSSKYKLCAFCYLNPTTNRAELEALAFLAEETADNFRSSFKYFKSMCAASPPSVFIVDKDFTEITVLKEVFIQSTILLCTFHVIKYVKNLIATAPVTVDIKNSVMTNFKEMVYACTEEIYEDRKNAFLLSTAGGLQVRTNKQYVPLKEQFMNLSLIHI